MAVPFSNTRLRVPRGFQSLLEGVAKEILQMQPNDIFAFSAVYFENLLQLRESGVVDPVTQMSQTQDRMYNNKAFQKPDVDVNSEHQQDAALKIQTKYRQHQSKAVVDQMRQDKAAVKIQAGIRGHLGRKRVANLRKEVAGSSRHSFNAEDENELEELAQEDEFNINEEEEETSRTHDSIDPETATKVEPEEETTIPKSPVSEVDGDIGIDLNDPEIQVAATKIQAGFRGMRTRQHLKPRQIEESKDYDEDLLARDEFAAFDETEDLERGEMESERHETPNSQVKRSGAQEDIMQEDEGAELEFCEDDPEMMKAIEEIQGSFRRLEADDENVDEVVENDEQENLEMEAAATKIQAGFKGMKLRRELKGNKVVKKVNNEEEEKEIRADEETEMEAAATKIQAGFKGMKLRKELKEKKVVKKVTNEEEPKEMQADEETEMEAAATKIQAGFKGMKLRRELKEKKVPVVKKVINEEPKEIQADEETGAENLDTEETSDVELRVAANKIQAGFRGYQTRKEVQKMRREKGEELTSQEKIKEEHEAEEEKNNDENEEKRVFAASKIQAGFKGYKTRREVDIARRQKAKVNDVKEEEEGHENHIVDEENQMKEAVEQFEEEP